MIDRKELDVLVMDNVPKYFVENKFKIEKNGSLRSEDDNLVITITLNFLERATFFVPSYLILVKLKSIETIIEQYIPEIKTGRKESYTYSFNKQKLLELNKLNVPAESVKIFDSIDVKKLWEEVKGDYVNLFLPMLTSLIDINRFDSIINSEYLNFTKLPPEFIPSTEIVLKKIVSAYISKNKNYDEILNFFKKFIIDKDPNSSLINFIIDIDIRLKEK